jgi:hypothetical protein
MVVGQETMGVAVSNPDENTAPLPTGFDMSSRLVLDNLVILKSCGVM